MAERAFGNWATSRKTVGSEGAARFEHGQLKAHSQDLFSQSLQLIQDDVSRDPTSFNDAKNRLAESFTMAVGQGLFRPEEARVRLHDAQKKLALMAMDDYYAIDRGKAMNSMDMFGLDASEKAKFKKRYQAEMRAEAAQARQARAEQRAELGAALPDADYLASQTGDVGELRSMATEFRKLGDVKTAERIERRAGVYENNYAAIRESRVMPLVELAASIDNLDKEISSLQGQGKDADARKLLTLNAEIETRKKIYVNRVKEITDDPMRAALQGEEPQAPSEQYVARLMARQEVMGKGIPGFVPEPVTKAMANDINAKFNAAQDPQEQAAMLAGLSKSYGKYAPLVMAQAKLPPAVIGIAPVVNALPPSVATRFTAAATAKPADLPPETKEMKDALGNSVILEAAISLAGSMYRSPEARKFAAGMADSLQNYVRMGGALSDIEDHFAVINDSGKRIIAPKHLVTPDLEDAMDARRSELVQEAAKKGTNLAERKLNMLWRGIYSDAFWVYDGTDGFDLMDARTGLAIPDQNGNAVRVKSGDKPLFNIDPYTPGDY
jgi:hypothetical protein